MRDSNFLQHTGYLPDAVFRGRALARLINDIVRFIKKKNFRFSAIAFRGMSGALVAPAVAAKMNKKLICVRKDGDGSHTCYLVEGYVRARTYIIIDDFIETAKTVLSITKELPGKCVGVVLYEDHLLPHHNALRLLIENDIRPYYLKECGQRQYQRLLDNEM